MNLKIYQKSRTTITVIMFVLTLTIALLAMILVLSLEIFIGLFILNMISLGTAITITFNAFIKVKNELTPYIIKTALDNLEEGILFANSLGNIIFINLKMRDFLRTYCSSEYRSVFSIWKQITALVKEAPEASKTNSLLIRNETQSFLFTKTQLSKYIQISFLDITEEECLLKEIKLMNQQEIKRQNELKRLFDSIKIVEKEQAALDLKYQIHDIIAQRIAILHHFLVQIKAPQSLLEIKTMMKGMFFDIHEHILRPDDKMCHLITSYLRIGVKLKITGENLLKDPQEIRIITKIIREATTNAIRHGGATKVNINITKIDGNTKVIITNNGTLPELINEDHGLGGIREAIKILKGEFKIETQTELRLIIKY